MSGFSSVCLDMFPKGNKSQANKKKMSVFYASAPKCNKEDSHPSLKPCFVASENGKGNDAKAKNKHLHIWQIPEPVT